VRTDAKIFGGVALTLALLLGPMAMPIFADGNGVSRTTQLPTEHLRNLRRQMIAGRNLATRDLRALADAADGLAAFKYGKWLEEQGKPQLLPDATHYYAIASYTDRDFALRRLVALLTVPDLELSATRQNEALEAMIRQAQTGNTDAAVALSSMYATGKPFGKDPEAMRHWLQVAANGGRGDAAIKLALAYMMPTDGMAADPAKARAALDTAAAQPDPGTKAMAQTLLARLGDMPFPVTVVSEGVSE
jgi:TPR repeat protein